MSKHYLNEVGTDLLFDTGVDLTSITTEYVYFKTPAGLTGTWSADLYNSYSEIAKAIGTYFVKHTLVSTDFTVSGEWEFQAFVASSVGTWWGETAKLNVYGLYE